MPQTKPQTVADRAEGQSVDVHPRTNGDVMLTPDDLLEGLGNFAFVDADGHPEGFALGNVEERDGWHLYEGPEPNLATRQTTGPLPAERPSFLFSQPSVRGHAPPTLATAARVPAPFPPRVEKARAERAGYPASTEERPYWFAWSLGVRLPSGAVLHTMLSPLAPCEPNGAGQCFRVPLPVESRSVAEYAGLWLTEPGASTADRPGPTRVQRQLRIADFASGHYDLTGPYRHSGRPAPTRNETELPAAGRAGLRFESRNTPCRIGAFRASASFATPRGEALTGPPSNPVTVAGSSYYGTDNPAGYGSFKVFRPTASSGSTGWYAYMLIGSDWYRVYDKLTGLGLTKPLPLSWLHIETAGWEGGEHWAQNDTKLLASASRPEVNASGIARPDAAPEPPTAFGAVLPEPGRRYFRVTDTYRGKESRPSAPVAVDLAAGEMARIVYRSPVNALPNASYVETDPDDLPFDHVVEAPAGAARVVSGEMVIEVLLGQEEASYSESTVAVEVDTSREWSVGSEFAVEDPVEGRPAGVVESVLVEEDASGDTVSETVLYSTSEVGGHEYYFPIAPAGASRAVASSAAAFGFVPAFAWNPATFAVRLVHRIMSAVGGALGAKNVRLRIRGKQLKDHAQRPRPVPALPQPRPPGKPPKPAPGTPLPPGGGTVVTPPPAPPIPPSPPQAEVRPVPEPDRPRSEGETLEDLEGFLNGIPNDWPVDRSPADASTTVAASPAAALSGSLGLLLKDTGTTETARANISKAISPGGRHDFGIFTRNRMANMPISGTVALHPLSTPDGRDLAWLELGADAERARLVIESGPKLPGAVSVILDGVRTEIPAQAAGAAARLELTSAPGVFGDVSVTLDGNAVSIPTGGEKQIVSLTVQAPRYNGFVRVTLDGVVFSVRVYHSDTAVSAATRIRRGRYPGWRVSGSRNQLIFTAEAPGPKGLCSYDRSTSAAAGRMSVTAYGENETAEELAARIRATRFVGWKTSGAGAVVAFTAVYAGQKQEAAFNPGPTGVVGAMQTTEPGFADTPEELAARIRTTVFAGWTAGGSGTEVTFVADDEGFKQDVRFDGGSTLVRGAAATTLQGKDADLFAVARDASGAVQRRRIMSALLDTNVWETDLAVSGAGTDEAIVSVWGAIGDAPRQLLARFESVDLTGLLAGEATLGVASESKAETTWELHVDDAKVTGRGLVYHRDHDSAGKLINQAHGYFVPNQPRRDDLLIQGPEMEEHGKPIAVLPGRTYAFSAFLRCRGVFGLAKPLHLTAILSDGSARPLGDITGEGVTGAGDWAEYLRIVEIPPGCHEVRLQSRSIGAGEIVMQEVVASPGAEPRRTGLYATSGFHTATLLVGTLRQSEDVYVGRMRRSLDIHTEAPDATSVGTLYRSARSLDSSYSGWTEQGDEVPQREIVEAHVALTGDGRKTPVLRSGFPRAEYDVVLGLKPLATFLKHDRSELPGGAFFGKLEEWSNRTKVGVRELPSGRIHRQAIFDPVGRIPGSILQVFTPEAREYVEERWGLELFTIEARAWGEVVWLKLAGQPEFERATGSETESPDGRTALYVASMPSCEVVERRPLL